MFAQIHYVPHHVRSAVKSVFFRDLKQSRKKTDITADLTWWGSLRLVPIKGCGPEHQLWVLLLRLPEKWAVPNS